MATLMAPAPAPGRSERRTAARRPARLGLLLALVPAAVLAAGGWAHRWLHDDAFINLRVVEQVVAGNGPVFNVGERVEAFTSPLWLAVLVLARATVGQVADIEEVTVGASLVTAVAAFVVGARVARRLHPRPAVAVPLGLGLVAAVPVVWDFATSGLEMGLVWLWLAGCWWVLVREAVEDADGGGARAAGWRGRWWPLVLVGLGPLIRPDLVLVTGLVLAAWFVLRQPGWRALVGDLAVAGALPVAYQVFRMGYYASIVPSTALAKDAGGLHLGQGGDYAARSPVIADRPAGHRKSVEPEWYDARFGARDAPEVFSTGSEGPDPTFEREQVLAARRALDCGKVGDLLEAVSEPLTPGRFLSNLVDSVPLTRFTVPADPVRAEARFC